jgi:hypothetical protein
MSMPDLPLATWQPNKSTTKRFTEFIDSPFTWGGLGVLIGIATASPALFKYAFWGAGIAIWIGFLRSGLILHSRKWEARTAVIVLSTGVFLFGWMRLYQIIPRPTEPLTATQLTDAVKNALSSTPNDRNSLVANIVEAIRQKQGSTQTERSSVQPPTQPAATENLSGINRFTLATLINGQANKIATAWREYFDEADK